MPRPRTRHSCLAVLVLCLVASGAFAQEVQLRYAPPDTNLTAGESCRLSILIDEPLEFRTIDVTVRYDPAVVASIGGGKGQLYTDSGIFTFAGFEETAPGEWHGYAVLMGSGLFVQGPGELYYWDFEALADGATPLHTVSVYLSRPDGTWYETVLLPDGRVTVGDYSAVTPPRAGNVPLDIAPNPFNPATTIAFELLATGPARLSVYDARGRRVAVLLDGFLRAGPVTVRWNGQVTDGGTAPSGTYLFRLDTAAGVQTAKGVLVE